MLQNFKKNVLLVFDLKVLNLYEQLCAELSIDFNLIVLIISNYETKKYQQQKQNFQDKYAIQFDLYKNVIKVISPLKFKNDTSINDFLIEKTTALQFKYSYNFALDYINLNKIDMILHIQDISLSNIALLKAAHDMNIPTMIPSAIMMEPDDHFHRNNSKLYVNENSTLYTKYVFSKKYGDYVKFNDKLFFYPAPIIEFLNKYNLLSQTPWTYGGSHFTKYFCVSNLYHYNSSIKYGIPKEKIKILGDINYDKLYLSYKKFNNKNKKTIIIAVPQFYEHNYYNLDKSKEEIEYLIEQVCNFQDYTILLSLHPSMKYENYSYLENKFHCTISKDPLYTIITKADLYICVQSNTILWATLCHIKTIVADYYDWDYSTSKGLSSCKVIINRGDYNSKNILKFINSEVSFQQDDILLSRDNVFNGNVLNSYKNFITTESQKITKARPKKYFILLTSLFFKCKNFYISYKISKLQKYIKKYKKFYIAPYNDMAESLTYLLNNEKFNGYLDNHKTDSDVKRIEELDLSESCIVIISPVYSKEIYNTYKNKTNNLYIMNW